MCDQRELYEGKSRLTTAQAELVRELTDCIKVLKEPRGVAVTPGYAKDAEVAAYGALTSFCNSLAMQNEPGSYTKAQA